MTVSPLCSSNAGEDSTLSLLTSSKNSDALALGADGGRFAKLNSLKVIIKLNILSTRLRKIDGS